MLFRFKVDSEICTVNNQHNMKKIALITRASSGIGKEFTHIYAEKGGDIIRFPMGLVLFLESSVLGHFPIQKCENMWPRMSSACTAPVMEPR